MPVRSLGKDSKRTEVNAEELGAHLRHHNPGIAVIEDVWSTANDGHVGAFSFGDSYGTVKGACGALSIPLTRVRPQVWKKTMRVTADKDTSRARAAELFPDVAPLFARKKDDGRAESALISFWGVCQEGVRIKQPLKGTGNAEGARG
jgi:crossover junction endodeoxyribonuclease RuvC